MNCTWASLCFSSCVPIQSACTTMFRSAFPHAQHRIQKQYALYATRLRSQNRNESSSGLRMEASSNERSSARADEKGFRRSGPFGVKLETNGDVLKFGIAAIVIGYGMKRMIELFGVPDLVAGQITTAVLSVASLVAWLSTYVFRVGTKTMTYAQQLKDYEDAVIEKRYQELTEDELLALSEELEEDL